MTACQERDASPIWLRSNKKRVEQRNRLRAAAWTGGDFVRKPKPQRRPLEARLHPEHLGPRSGFLDTLTFPLFSIAPLQVSQRRHVGQTLSAGIGDAIGGAQHCPIHRWDDANKHCTASAFRRTATTHHRKRATSGTRKTREGSELLRRRQHVPIAAPNLP